ncbi:Purine nucleoside phosphorylase 2 [uncultured Alphaproteobacteria bacterium]|uniref:Purine nucleoside phosphorylase n=1 Tax=uncultured Alphaproteobacteria bacterium TaxID=91750 RepID=A0A212JB12_9PROT|nr:Purine nucleoside phosphorylase 2 [uncultured Alphaproteobacteria bacterium]
MTIRLVSDGDAVLAAAALKGKFGGIAPEIGVICGSGLAELATALGDRVEVPYESVPGFPRLSVAGHAARVAAGTLGRRRVAMLQGRVHSYETGDADGMAVPLATLALLGCKTLIVTNAAGSLRPEAGPGAVGMIVDHINLTGLNPLTGATGDGRFVDMVDAYDPGLRERFRAIAVAKGMALAEGVYMWFPGPSFETPAEIRAAKLLGADFVGMSTVPEVILARALGMRVAAFSLVTNLAAGMGGSHLSHARTLARAATGAAALRDLLVAFMEEPA